MSNPINMNLLIIYFVIYFYFLVNPISTLLNSDELKISKALVKELEIRHCIFVGHDNENDVISEARKLASANIPVSFVPFDQLIPFIDQNDSGLLNLGLVFSEENLNRLRNVSKILETENKSYKMARFKWLVFVQDLRTFFKGNHKLIAPLNCEFIVINKLNSTTYKLTEYYDIKNASFYFDFGMWDNDFGLNVTKLTFRKRRSNLHKRGIVVISRGDVECDDENENAVCQIYAILNQLATMMNFTYHRSVLKQHENIAVKFSKYGDIGDFIAPLHIDFHSHLDPLDPIIKTQINWYIKYPSTELRSDYYLQPFGFYVWIALVSTVIIVTVLIVKVQSSLQNENRSFTDNLFMGFETLCNQCGCDNIQNASTRTICIFLRLTTVISIALHGAIITSFLAVEIPRPPFTTLKEFVENGEYKLEIAQYSFAHVYFQKSSDPVMKTIYKNFTRYFSAMDYEKVRDNVCHSKIAIIGYQDDVHAYYTGCFLYKVPEHITTVWFVLHMQKNSPFTKLLWYNYIWCFETGAAPQKRRTDPIYRYPNRFKRTEEPFRPIEISQMYQVVSIPFIGILISSTIIVIEILNMKLFLRK